MRSRRDDPLRPDSYASENGVLPGSVDTRSPMNALMKVNPKTVLIWSSVGLLSLAGCSDNEAPKPPVAPERIPAEVEKAYQEREALKFGIDQLDREEAERQRVGADPPESATGNGDQPPAERPRP